MLNNLQSIAHCLLLDVFFLPLKPLKFENIKNINLQTLNKSTLITVQGNTTIQELKRTNKSRLLKKKEKNLKFQACFGQCWRQCKVQSQLANEVQMQKRCYGPSTLRHLQEVVSWMHIEARDGALDSTLYSAFMTEM